MTTVMVFFVLNNSYPNNNNNRYDSLLSLFWSKIIPHCSFRVCLLPLTTFSNARYGIIASYLVFLPSHLQPTTNIYIYTDTQHIMSNASLIVTDSKEALPLHLNTAIATLARQAISERGAFTIALSGGSLPSFLATLHQCFNDDTAMDARWDKWHILLADERCVEESHPDSNLGSIRKEFLVHTKIPESQIHGIDAATLKNGSTQDVATQYETVVRKVLEQASGGILDLAVLGFGPDGHTCSLFPGHPLLQETQHRWVAPITDSPKPPPNRITLTFAILNQYTRHVIVCGAGTSKGPILQKVIAQISVSDQGQATTKAYTVDKGIKYEVQIQRNPAPFPCAMVEPNVTSSESSTLTWIVDADAMKAADSIKFASQM